MASLSTLDLNFALVVFAISLVSLVIIALTLGGKEVTKDRKEIVATVFKAYLELVKQLFRLPK
jgi:hypothetical protein